MDSFVDRLFALWTADPARPDLEAAFAELYTDPVTVNGSPLSVADLTRRARSLHGAFSGLRAEILQVVEGGEEALAVAFLMRGTHTGPYAGPFGTVEPTGAEVAIRTIDVLTLTDGRISAIWVNADDAGLLAQLGRRPAAAEV